MSRFLCFLFIWASCNAAILAQPAIKIKQFNQRQLDLTGKTLFILEETKSPKSYSTVSTDLDFFPFQRIRWFCSHGRIDIYGNYTIGLEEMIRSKGNITLIVTYSFRKYKVADTLLVKIAFPKEIRPKATELSLDLGSVSRLEAIIGYEQYGWINSNELPFFYNSYSVSSKDFIVLNDKEFQVPIDYAKNDGTIQFEVADFYTRIVNIRQIKVQVRRNVKLVLNYSGKYGQHGKKGASGADGSFASNGADGKNGSAGESGGHGAEVKLEVLRQIDSIYEIGVSANGERKILLLDFKNGATIQILANGGFGGFGGDGGDGGDGGRGMSEGENHSGVSGGMGGFSGEGGAGGNGGNGGSLSIYCDSAFLKYVNQIEFENKEGLGGRGGRRGYSGVSDGRVCCLFPIIQASVLPDKYASNGQNGIPGAPFKVFVSQSKKD